MKIRKDLPPFDPNKPSEPYEETKVRKDLPPFDPNKPSEPYEGLKAEDFKQKGALDYMGEALDTLDIGRAGVATGVMGAIREDQTVPEALGEYGERLFTEGPTSATTQAPRGRDIVKELGVPDVSFADVKDPIIGQVPVLKDIKLNEVTGFALDMGMDPLTYTSGLAKAAAVPIKAMAKKLGNAQAERALSKYISNTKYLREGVTPDTIGAQAYKEDVLKLVRNPRKLQQKLIGKYDVEEISGGVTSGFVRKKSGSKKGLIENIGDDVEATLNSINEIQKIKPKRKYFRNQVSQDLYSQMDEVGMVMDDKLIPKAEDLIDNVLGPKKDFTIPELYDAKRRLNSQIKSREFYKNMDEAQTFKNEVLIGLTRKIDDTILKSVGNVPIDTPRKAKIASRLNERGIKNYGDYYLSQNKRMSNLLDLREISKTEAFKELKGPDAINYIMQMTGIGALSSALSLAGDYPSYAAIAGGTFEGLRRTGRFIEEAGPIGVARMSKAVDKASVPLIRSLPQARRMMRKENYRSPDSFVEQIEMTPLSRNTEQMAQQPDMFLAKLAQQKPESYDMAREAIRQGGMVFDSFVKQLVIEAPHLFEQDKYNRIDGKITDPASKAAAIRDVKQMDDMRQFEKAEIIDRLNKTGEFPL